MLSPELVAVYVRSSVSVYREMKGTTRAGLNGGIGEVLA